MYSRVTIKPPSDGTCTQVFLEMVHVLKSHYKASLKCCMYSKVNIKPPSDDMCTQGEA